MERVNKKVYQAILVTNKLLEDYISGVSFYSTMDKFLDLLLSSTNSENGFIGKISGSDQVFSTIVCNKDINGTGLSIKQLKESIGNIELDKSIRNYFNQDDETLFSYISIPIEFDAKLIGFIGLTNKASEYGNSDLEILRFAKNSISAILNNQFNISALHQEKLKKSEERYALAMEESNSGVWEWVASEFDKDWCNTDHEWWSAKFYKLLGYEDQEIPSNSNTFFSLIHPDDREITFKKFNKRRISEEFESYDIKHRLRTKNGSYRWFRSRGKIYKDKSNKVIRMTGSIRDIQEEYELVQKLYHQTAHDKLTGVNNRQTFVKKITHLLNSSRGGTHVLAIIDIDQFKVINDVNGNEAGNKVLCFVAKFLKDSLRKNDVLARIGGDEFGLIIQDCTLQDATVVLNSIATNLNNQKLSVKEEDIKLTLSIGVSLIDEFCENYETVLAAADSACEEAKQCGTNLIRVYSATDTQFRKHKDKMKWVGRIRSALKEKRIKLFAQPIVKITTMEKMTQKEAHHFEILVRMQEHDGSFVSPSEFMPIVERFRLASEFDRYLINAFCRWYDKYKNNIPQQSRFSINLSGQSITDKQVLEQIVRNINAYMIPPEVICLEITETAAIGNLAYAKEFIDSLRNQGLSFSLDDFGQGLSSLTYLKELPVDFLKIDGTFIKNLRRHSKDYFIVESINKVGHSLGYRTIAECVEDEATLGIVRELDVDYVQGYLFGDPQPIENLAKSQILRASAGY